MRHWFFPLFIGLGGFAVAAEPDIEARVRALESKVVLLDATRVQQSKELARAERRLAQLEHLFVESARDKPVLLYGAVRDIGIFKLEAEMTLGDLIVKANGFTDESDHFHVLITRFDAQGKKQTIEFRFSVGYPTDRELKESPRLLPGDIVYVPEIIR